MEADWEFEIAADAPVVDAAWSGFVDLRTQPERAWQLPESATLPALSDALVKLNSAPCQVWTSKCDVWEEGPVDGDEFDAETDAATSARACYIDLLPAEAETWSTLDAIADWCRSLCATLRPLPLRHCRVDLVIRRAFAAPDQAGLGITAYLAGCGPCSSTAAEALGACVRALADTVCGAAPA